MNGRDHVQHGLELDDAIEMAAMFEAAGADSISVSGGVHASRPYMVVPGMSVDRGCYVSYGDAIRKRVKIPVMVVGRINTPDLAEQILEDGQADFICLSRALIADPYFPAKAKAGRVETIAPCIACNECIATVHRHKGLACTVNPMVSRELELKPLLALQAGVERVVVVIGSGAAGLSAAVTAARRGHDVHLFEKEGVIGGQLLLAHQPPHRGEIRNALRYFTSEIERLGIPVNLNRSFSADDARALKPEAIIVATGASAVRPDVPGSDLPHVLSGWRVIAGLEQAGPDLRRRRRRPGRHRGRRLSGRAGQEGHHDRALGNAEEGGSCRPRLLSRPDRRAGHRGARAIWSCSRSVRTGSKSSRKAVCGARCMTSTT